MATQGLPVALALLSLLAGGCFTSVLVASRLGLPRLCTGLALVLLIGRALVGYLLLTYQGLSASDAYGYHQLAEQLSSSWSGNGEPPDMTVGKEGWIWLLAAMYFVAAPDPMLGVGLNAVFSALALLLTAKAAQSLWGSREAATGAAVVFVLIPGFWLWGSIPLRESGVVLAVAMVALGLVRQRPSWTLVVSGLGALVWLRGSLAVLVGMAIAVSLILPGRSASASKRQGTGRVGRLVALAVCAVISSVVLQDLQHETSTERMSTVRAAQSDSASTAFDVAGDQSAPVVVAITGMPRVLLGPFPWELPSVGALIPMAIAWFVVLWFAWRGVRLGSRTSRRVLPLVLSAGAVFIALALYSGNYGTMIRLREQVLPFLIPLAVGGWHAKSLRGASQTPAAPALEEAG